MGALCNVVIGLPSCRWAEVWEERLAATEQLRVCIAAKRISFRLFKQIYWQSFDEDIQVSLLSRSCRRDSI